MVLSNGVASMFKNNAHIVQTYSPTLAKACVWCNRIDGNGVGFEVDSKHL